MAKEIELRVINIDKDEAVAKLKKIGAKFVAERNFKRVEYLVKGKVGNNKKGSKTWIRIRTDGKATTMTLKERKGEGLLGTNEWEVEVDDFKTGVQMLSKMLKPTIYEENQRMQYEYDGVEIVLDKWPFIQWMIEIEGPSEGKVNAVFKELGLKKGTAVKNMSVLDVYKQEGRDLIKLQKRNREKLAKLIEE